MRQHSGIGVLDKAVGVLHTVAQSPCGLAELCERTELPRATAYRLAAALEVHRLLARGDDGRWRLGPAVTELAAHVNDPLLAAGSAVLPLLRETTGESVQLYRREGTDRVCVAALEPAAGLRDTVPVGARLPMTAGSGAKVLLAHSDAATQKAVLANAKFTARTLAEVRRRGWAQSVAEREPGVASVSAPVRDSRGAVIAAISVSGPIDRIGRRPGARWAADLVSAAEALTRRL
ncbi:MULTISPECIES: IclR family transcriptional regulator [Mycobacterium avium complex (MAC)]|uniref:IclR family transcriptional regulator n=1 Tax=Mycobacterium timonense TaxID=701043 RepID=A0ABX3TL70_9MYCO|nr:MULTISPECIES: IclR family transcriptional regulator [Mycobacterium avium complex (MAC)]MBZ4547577.1 IclR family transcriptional regulator [Mycobacterium avium subsp. hominissuis]MBZ4582437.1 IclR family transcriptional regulator [Mycobacterium avium subsp. hominissuis]MBZ4597822.1 IclR family transcriptional regulator [Mycobacterium avium subsp. hominissuis]ORB79574.1 IclR family transcriptional regulator [Mycobacterium timonense]PBJ55527.1 IclR family transcriptional regulator [Mycobacteri